MKAKNLLLALATAALFLGPAFGMAKNQKKIEVEGVIEYYGNAPFPRLCLKTEDGSLYYLDADKADKEKLEALSASFVRAQGILTGKNPPPEVPFAKVLKITNWKKL